MFLGRQGCRPLRKGWFVTIILIYRLRLIITTDTARRVPTAVKETFVVIYRAATQGCPYSAISAVASDALVAHE